MKIHLSKSWEIEQIRKEIKKLEQIKKLPSEQNQRLEELKRANKVYEEGGEVYHSEEEDINIQVSMSSVLLFFNLNYYFIFDFRLWFFSFQNCWIKKY